MVLPLIYIFFSSNALVLIDKLVDSQVIRISDEISVSASQQEPEINCTCGQNSHFLFLPRNMLNRHNEN